MDQHIFTLYAHVAWLFFAVGIFGLLAFCLVQDVRRASLWRALRRKKIIAAFERERK